jgi:hypothetical protein
VLLILLGLTRGSDFSAREAIGDFLRIGVGVRHAKSPTGIRGKRTEALRHAAKWLKSSLETVWKIVRKLPKVQGSGTQGSEMVLLGPFRSIVGAQIGAVPEFLDGLSTHFVNGEKEGRSC